jgi:hypothetical protein
MSGIYAGNDKDKLDSLKTSIDAVKTELTNQVSQLRTEQFYFQQNLLKQVREQIDLEGCTQFYSAGSNITIAAGSNLNGVYIPLLSWSFYSTNISALLVGGTQVTPYNGTADVQTGVLQNIFVPAGVEVVFYSNSASVPVAGAYQIL